MNENPSNKATHQLSREINRRRRLEEELTHTRERLQILFEFAPDAYYLNDLDAVFIDGNRAAERLTGYDRHELIGKNYFDLELLDEEGKKKSIQMLEKIKAGKIPEPEEYRIKKKCGQMVHVEINAYPTNIGGKDVILGIARDVTDRKETEKKLRRAQEGLELRVKERTCELEEINKELKIKSINLEEANTTLKVLLKRRDEDQIEMEEKIIANFNELVLPIFGKLKASSMKEQQKTWMEIMETNLMNITSSLVRGLNLKFMRLTPNETQISNLIRQGMCTKEISGLLGIAVCTVNSYRDSIRQKLGIKNKKINLKTYLQTIK